MKKSIIAVLVLVTTVASLIAAPATDLYDYYNGIFSIKNDGSMTLTYYSPDSKYGQVTEFGYFKVSNPEEKFMLDDHLTGNETIKINDLKAGDEIAFYMSSKKGGDDLTIYSTNVTLANSTTYFTVTDYGYTFGDTKWDKGVLAWKESTTVNPTPAPSGQPLPGALTTMLIAGGCAAYLKRKKAARK